MMPVHEGVRLWYSNYAVVVLEDHVIRDYNHVVVVAV